MKRIERIVDSLLEESREITCGFACRHICQFEAKKTHSIKSLYLIPEGEEQMTYSQG